MGLQDFINQNSTSNTDVSSIIAPPPGEHITKIPLSNLHSFNGHTFHVIQDSPDYQALATSIKDNGIQQPLRVRPSPTNVGSFEILVGHRRCDIARGLGLLELPCIVTNCDDDTAIQIMAESNIQRPGWLPSERAETYKAHLEATQRKSGITAGRGSGTNSRNDDEAAKLWGISGDALRIYIKLNDLLPPLLHIVDQGRVAVMGAYALSFMSDDQQELVQNTLTTYPKKKVSASKCKEIRLASDNGQLNEDTLLRILGIKRDIHPTEKAITIKLGSSTLLRKSTIRKALNDSDVIDRIEQVLIQFAEDNNLPFE